MTFSLHAFSSSDTAFDVQAAALEDQRPHPTEAALVQLGHAIMTELLDVVGDTALEDVQAILCESLIGAFHSAAGRIERDGDRARDRMRLLERDFDGSEMADVELQDATRITRASDVAQAAAELVRDAAAEVYTTLTGEVWTAWRGSRRGTRMTAAQLEAKAAIRTVERRRRGEADPGGPVVAFRAAPLADTAEDAQRIFDALNWAKSEWPDMALATTGAKGAERIAIRWAGRLRGFALAYLGQNDSLLTEAPSDLISRGETENYPSDFSPMTDAWIERLSRRGDQLTLAVLRQHAPELVVAGRSESAAP